MRVLQLWTIFGIGGVTRHVLDLTAWLRTQGHDVSLAGSSDVWLDSTKDEHFYDIPLYKVTEGGGRKFFRMIQALYCAFKVRRLLKERDIELIHAQESAPAVVARLATLGLGIPVAVTYHGSEPGRVAWFGRVGRWAANLVITPSHNAARDLHEQGGIPMQKLKVIGLGINPQPPTTEGDVPRLRKKLLGEDGRLLVLTVARLEHQKGIDILIQVIQQVLAQRRDIRFVVVGDGIQRKKAAEWSKTAGVQTHLEFVGPSSEVHVYMAAADLFLLTSRWEALPITIPEAFRQGLPVIATDCSGVSEMVDEKVGRVLPIGAVEEIAAAVLHVLDDEQQRKQMSVNAITRSQEARFSPEAVHKTFERTYAELIESCF